MFSFYQLNFIRLKGGGMMKERFTAEEWEKLMHFQIDVPILVAFADGRFDEKEQREILSQAKDAGLLIDTLHRELYEDFIDNLEAIAQSSKISSAKRWEDFSEIKQILKRRLSQDEYERFIASVFINGIKVAKASGLSLIHI